ncbi:hypothetical protein QTP86_026516 [Hemibagrus guttatus]|nr:hypothetical protein QTP86_026516 [Hemibagrus guttatus]
MSVALPAVRDTKWLTLEVCRQFQRGTCSRSDEECKFAHPPKSCQVDNGRVIACFDSLKGRCSRDNCKYLHPPSHLKSQLEINGRNNLIQQKTAAAMLAQQMQFMLPGSSLPAVSSFPVGQSLGPGPGISYSPYLSPVTHGMGLVATEMLPSNPVIVPGSPAVAVQSSNSSSSSQKTLRSDKLETQSSAKVLKRPLEATVDMAFPHSMLQPLAKRVALEKSVGPGGLFNPSVLHYQQALANTPLQPSTALFPTGTQT